MKAAAAISKVGSTILRLLRQSARAIVPRLGSPSTGAVIAGLAAF